MSRAGRTALLGAALERPAPRGGRIGSGPGAAAAAPELLQLLFVAGEQVAVTVGDAGNGARRGAVGGLVGALVGHVLPELPAAVRPGKRHLGLLARVGDPQ